MGLMEGRLRGLSVGWSDVTVTEIYTDGKEKVVKTDEGDEFRAKAVIVCSGGTPRKLGIPGEAELGGRGVSYCAICDGAFFRGQVLAVVGGGDAAVEEATFLTRYAAKVYVVHRRDKLRASKIMQEKAFKNPKIEFIWNTGLEEILGEPQHGVTGVRLKNLQTNVERVLPCTGVFIAIGHKPNTDLFKGQVEMDEVGYIKTSHRSTATNIPGVFACGDVQDSTYRQAVTAAGTGCMAALDAERYLDHLPVVTLEGDEVTMEGEHLTPDHQAIIEPDGTMVPNKTTVLASTKK